MRKYELHIHVNMALRPALSQNNVITKEMDAASSRELSRR